LENMPGFDNPSRIVALRITNEKIKNTPVKKMQIPTKEKTFQSIKITNFRARTEVVTSINFRNHLCCTERLFFRKRNTGMPSW